MKIFTRFLLSSVAFFMATSFLIAQSQLQFEGLYSEGEGGAAWNADGYGPEPYGNGHGDIYYYVASRDYVDPTCSSGAHLLDNISGFPLFEQALIDNGFTAEQVTLKISLSSLGEDIEGIDWFHMNNTDYCNFCPVQCYIELDGHPCIKAIGDYSIYTVSAFIQAFESGYMKVFNNSGMGPNPVQNVACAFMNDMGNEEIQFNMDVASAAILSGNGRTGGYFDVNCSLEKGLPTLPLQGLNADHEGFAGWDADGTGLEPYGNGHLTQLYYGASLDYDNIDPDPAACLGHFLEGSTGFSNTKLQLQYRGFEIGDLKMKLGLESLGPDVQGKDWGYQNGYHWCNYYNNGGIIELNGEPILAMMQDTNRLLATVSHWTNASSIGKVYNISQNASPEAQFVAQSFQKDVGSHYLKTIGSNIQYHSIFNGNGRDGALYELEEAALMGVHQNATFIPEGPVSGVWDVDNSPYFIDGHLSIENGQTLTIAPGVEVKVRGPYHFDVQGTILAEGSADEKILFTRSNPNLWWDGIDFNNTPPENDTSKFDHCIFEYGYAQGSANGLESGGAFFIRGFDALTVSNSVFRNNMADGPGSYAGYGGAIALWASSPLIQKCIFYNNDAKHGGAIYSYNYSDPIVSNCLFYNNNAENGGAICCDWSCNGIYINNTISDNSANHGGALYFYNHSDPLFINTILWGNKAAISGNQVYNSLLSSRPDFYYCDIEEGQAGFGGQNINGDYLFNIDSDPFFSGDSEFPYSLLDATSPCWNAGTPDTSAWYYPQYLPETCLCSAPRIADGCLDIGAYELLVTGIIPLQDIDAIVAEIYPNPFTDQVTLDFQLQEPGTVTIELLDLYGRQMTVFYNQWQQAGNHKVQFAASALPPGIYFCRLQAGNKFVTRKIVKVQ